jgi:hypothetical protein
VLSTRGPSEYHDCRVDEAVDFLGVGEYQASKTLYIVGAYQAPHIPHAGYPPALWRDFQSNFLFT